MDDQHRIVLRLFSRAAARIGSAAHLAMNLGIPYAELTRYLQGNALPPEEVLLKAVAIVVDELPAIRAGFAPEAWASLRLPR